MSTILSALTDKTQTVEHGSTSPRLPIIVTAGNDRDLGHWFVQNNDWIAQGLRETGGFIFRGFDIPDSAAFKTFSQACMGPLLPYVERSTPRQHVSDGVYTSTEYPADQDIALHNEFSYGLRWPLRIAFFCEQPADEGGATPIVDARLVYRLIAPEIRDAFERQDIMYVRRYGWGIDLSWQESFGTTDKGQVEEHCRANSISFEWEAGNKLVTRQIRQASAVHPHTHEKVWFNQAHLFHVSNLPEDMRSALIRILGNNLPREALHGDGSPIAENHLTQIRRVIRDNMVSIPWQKGDVMLLDNMLIMHGRGAFRGNRKVLVAMGTPHP